MTTKQVDSLASLLALHKSLVLSAQTQADWDRVHMVWLRVQKRAHNLGIATPQFQTFVANAIAKEPNDRTDDERRAIQMARKAE